MRTGSAKLATPKQIKDINDLLDRLEEHEEDLSYIYNELNADYGKGEGFDDWLRRQTIEEASGIIEYLKLL